MSVSIIICTYNRSDTLIRTLDSLTRQTGCALKDIELVVVDNNSSDNTKDVIESFVPLVPIKYVHEPNQGLSVARNRGISESHGESLLFTDDDVCLDTGWLSAYLRAIREYPDVGFFGGRIRPDWDLCSKPKWLKSERLALLSGVLLDFDFGEETRPYRLSDEGPIGASFGVRRWLFQKIGLFRTDLGVAGIYPGRGEDTEFMARARNAGAQGVYVGEALCWHRVHPERLRLSHMYKHGLAKGRGHLVCDNTTQGSVYRAIEYVIRGLFQLAKGRGDRFRQCLINSGIQMGLRRGP